MDSRSLGKNTSPVSQEYDGKGGFQDACTEWVQLTSKPGKELNLIYTKQKERKKERKRRWRGGGGEEEKDEDLGARTKLNTIYIILLITNSAFINFTLNSKKTQKNKTHTEIPRGRGYGDICIHIADSLCYTAETNTTL